MEEDSGEMNVKEATTKVATHFRPMDQFLGDSGSWVPFQETLSGSWWSSVVSRWGVEVGLLLSFRLGRLGTVVLIVVDEEPRSLESRSLRVIAGGDNVPCEVDAMVIDDSYYECLCWSLDSIIETLHRYTDARSHILLNAVRHKQRKQQL